MCLASQKLIRASRTRPTRYKRRDYVLSGLTMSKTVPAMPTPRAHESKHATGDGVDNERAFAVEKPPHGHLSVGTRADFLNGVKHATGRFVYRCVWVLEKGKSDLVKNDPNDYMNGAVTMICERSQDSSLRSLLRFHAR